MSVTSSDMRKNTKRDTKMSKPLMQPDHLPKKILLIEDDADIRLSVQELLESENYIVECAPHGQIGLECLRSSPRPPNLILLDLRMPVMGGKEFVEALEIEFPKLAHSTPIVLFTASGSLLYENEVKATAEIKKPLDIDELLETIAKLVA